MKCIATQNGTGVVYHLEVSINVKDDRVYFMYFRSIYMYLSINILLYIYHIEPKLKAYEFVCDLKIFIDLQD